MTTPNPAANQVSVSVSGTAGAPAPQPAALAAALAAAGAPSQQAVQNNSTTTTNSQPAAPASPKFNFPNNLNKADDYIINNKPNEKYKELLTAAILYIKNLKQSEIPDLSFEEAITLIVDVLKEVNNVKGGGSSLPYSLINNAGDLLDNKYNDGIATAGNLLNTGTASTVGMQVKSMDPTASFPLTLSNRVTPILGGPI